MMVMRTKDTRTQGSEHRPGRVFGFRDVRANHNTHRLKSTASTHHTPDSHVNRL